MSARHLVEGWRRKAYELLLAAQEDRQAAKQQALDNLDALEASAKEVRAVRQQSQTTQRRLQQRAMRRSQRPPRRRRLSEPFRPTGSR